MSRSFNNGRIEVSGAGDDLGFGPDELEDLL
jgi:hypothetical protein